MHWWALISTLSPGAYMSLNNRHWYSANFFRKQGILVDEGDGDGVDGDFGDCVGGEVDDDCCGP